MMPAWPIEWHENNLKTYRENYARKQQEVDRMVGELVRWEANIIKCQMQIDAAKKAGKKAFDPDKYLKPRDAASHADNLKSNQGEAK